LHLPGIDREGVKKTHPINPTHPAQQPQSRLGLGFPGSNRFQVQQHVHLRPVDLGKDVTVIILDDFVLLALGIRFLDLSPATALTTSAAAVKVFIGIQTDKEQAMDLAAFQGLVGFELLVDIRQGLTLIPSSE
jgi:hypothetical protein